MHVNEGIERQAPSYKIHIATYISGLARLVLDVAITLVLPRSAHAENTFMRQEDWWLTRALNCWFFATVTVPLATANIFQWQLQRELALLSLRRARVQVELVVQLHVC